ncbi:MAG: coenzyme F420-0:L-glutamate ligase [Candidatus Pacebacteria bacterium]|nr:coenzyme F420-0:L-glutamate ligase [Candidatus Paceibacterota bacterium]
MQYIPIKTRIMQPPKDDLFAVLDKYLTGVQEGDVVLITSKIVAIHQGRCIPNTEVTKRQLVEQEADYLIEGHTKYAMSPLAIKYHAMFYGAGIDESNANDHFILLPQKAFDIAEEIWKYLKQKHTLKNVGVIITDSHSQPMRMGAIGVSLAWWGFHPIESHKGKLDLFNRHMQFCTTNIVDCIAAGSNAVSGETAECTPIIMVRDVPNLTFTNIDTRHEVFQSQKDDIYYPLMKPFYTNEE